YYLVSNTGKVKRIASKQGAVVGRVLSMRPKKGGYNRVTLHSDSGMAQKLVHRLVAEAFLGPCPQAHCCNHIDGDKTNNHVSNIEYVTWPENTRHAKRMGLLASGGSSGRAKLTDEQAQEIRFLGDWVFHTKLAKLYGVNPRAIYNIVHNITYTAILKEAAEA